jgi:hypothetical protein
MVLSEMRLNLLKHQSMNLPTNEDVLWSEEHDLEYVAVALARQKVIRLTSNQWNLEFPESHYSHARNRKGLEL